MKTSSLLAGLMTCTSLVCSCDASFDSLSIERSWYDARYGVQAPDTASAAGPSVISCIVEYPSGYDWRRDSLVGNVGCRLLVYRDNSLIRSVPTGPGHETSPEADTHFLFGEDLYTVWRRDGRIVIKKNGRECVRYASSEIIRGILPAGEELWTLGTDGNGLALRRNGTAVFERRGATVPDSIGENGTDISGALYYDNGGICFSYEKGGVWHIVCDGEDSVAGTGGIEVVSGVRRISGHLYVMGKCPDSPGPYLSVDGGAARHFYYSVYPESDFRLLCSDGSPWFALCSHKNPRTVTTEVWDMAQRRLMVTSGMCFLYSLSDDPGYVALACTGLYFVSRIESCIYVKAPGLDPACFSAGHYFSGSRGAAFSEGVLAVGLTPAEGEPFVWRNGEVTSFHVHGFVSTVGFISGTID